MTTTQQQFCLLASLITLFFSSHLYAQCDPALATLSSLEGKIDIRPSAEETWHPAASEEMLCAGDTVRVSTDSRAALTLADHTLVRLGPSTTITLTGPQEERGLLVELLEGITHFMTRVPRTLEVSTPFVNAGVEGTEFLVRVDSKETFVSVFEGKVSMENEAGRLLLRNGQSASAGLGTPPVMQAVAHPRDAVQWTLYYPPLYSTAGHTQWLTENPLLSEAASLHFEGKSREALQLLEQSDLVDSDLLTFRAALYLAVGQVERALEDIENSLALTPNNGDAIALRSIIAVVQGDSEQALPFAEAAVKTAPKAIAPQLALSYALQAHFRLDDARLVLKEAAANAPDNALVWARLAELHLMFRDLQKAGNAAQRAIELNPDSAHAHMVQGYTHLVAMDTQSASQSFHTAIALAPSAPLPRLGLGLVLIRDGKLQQGRRAIEIAAILDPGNALVRSYLGKAYFEEKRDSLAEDQYTMAMELDPLDPTAYFYSAILKQTDNRPIEALESLQQAINNNDNRAVYRSRLLLDEDQATRSASIAGIYNTLGFDRLARIEADHSLSLDPGNYSAHRFLADSYSKLPRHEIARASELLKSQLLQPLNHSPLQPHIAESDLFVIERAGAADAAYNEYHPLFTQDDITLQSSIMGGSHNTLSDELILAGTKDRYSYSLGRYHYESDGFRENNDLQHDIYNAFGQVAFTPNFSMQAEYRYRETDAGDLKLRFDPEIYKAHLRDKYEKETGRIGFHYQPRPGHHLLGSAIYQELDDLNNNAVIQDLSPYNDLVPFDLTDTTGVTRYEQRTAGKAEQVELQYLHSQKWVAATYGASYLEQEYERTNSTEETFVVPDDRFIPTPLSPPFPPEPNVPYITSSSETDIGTIYSNAYVYFNFNVQKDMVWTLGASYDSFKYIDGDDTKRTNPKVGLNWKLTADTQVRAAWFKTTRRPFTSNQTIEPTQIAGFNQFFDETGGSLTEQYGLAFDHKMSHSLYTGLIGSQRESEQPRFGVTNTPNILEEDLYEAYLFLILNNRFTFTTRIIQEKLEQSYSLPGKLETLRIPVGLRYFGANGISSSVVASYVDQYIESSNITGKDEDIFWNVDASIGYKLPQKYGSLRLSIKNVLDEKFNYQETGASEPLSATYLPERYIVAELYFNAF